MKSDSGQELIAIGKIVKPHGIKGELKVIPFSGLPEDLLEYACLQFSPEIGAKKYTVKKSRVQAKFAVLKLDQVQNRNAAENLVGLEVYVLKADMPELGADEYYWHEMQGLKVVTDKGNVLGHVSSLLATGANDVLVVTGNDKEFLIPVIDDIILSRDIESKIIVIKPLPGLLEINDPDAV